MAILGRAAVAVTIYLCVFTVHLSSLPMKAGQKMVDNKIKKENRMKALARAAAIQKNASAKSATRLPRSGCMHDGVCAFRNGPGVLLYKEASSSSN